MSFQSHYTRETFTEKHAHLQPPGKWKFVTREVKYTHYSRAEVTNETGTESAVNTFLRERRSWLTTLPPSQSVWKTSQLSSALRREREKHNAWAQITEGAYWSARVCNTTTAEMPHPVILSVHWLFFTSELGRWLNFFFPPHRLNRLCPWLMYNKVIVDIKKMIWQLILKPFNAWMKSNK